MPRLDSTLTDRVIFNEPCAAAIAAEATRLGSQRVFLMVSSSLNKNTDAIRRVVGALGLRHAGTYEGMPSHTPRDAVVDAAAKARSCGADLIVTIGGGSLTDAGKVVQLALATKAYSFEALESYKAPASLRLSWSPDSAVRQICVPTTLSGGEFSFIAGCSNTRLSPPEKQGFVTPLICPRVVILDPEISAHTPAWLWLSTGVRSVDHCVEAICSVKANAYTDGVAMDGLRLLTEGLRRCRADPGDMEGRSRCQIGMWKAASLVTAGVPFGASHGIGHVLGGTAGVPHGYTSCVMLPFVLEHNDTVLSQHQRDCIVGAFGGSAGDRPSLVVGGFIESLGLPRSLEAVGVTPAMYSDIGRLAMKDQWVLTNPRKISGPEDVIGILRAASQAGGEGAAARL